MAEITIKMLETVRPDFFFAPPGTILRKGEIYPALSNRLGAISGVCKNGEKLGVKPGEFEFMNAPEWVLKIWRADNG